MKIPNLSFVLGFRQASSVILANEAFTEPEPYEPVLTELGRIGPNLELEGPELRIECSIFGGQPKIVRGGYRFVRGDRREQEYWRILMLKLAELGAEYLNKSIAALCLLPVGQAVDDYLKACVFPQPEHVEIAWERCHKETLDGLTILQHTVELHGTQVKLRLPNLSFLPFPKTITQLMLDKAQLLVAQQADRQLAEQTGSEFDPQ